jgi:cell division transport system permease protein
MASSAANVICQCTGHHLQLITHHCFMAFQTKKKKVGSYPNTMIVLSLTAALFLIGSCGLLVIQSKKLITIIKQSIEVRVMLDKDIDSTKRVAVQQTLSTKPYVLKEKTGAQVVFFTKDQAADELMADTKENFKEFLGENPLHDSFRVKVEESYFTDAKLKEIKTDIEKIEGVFEVAYQENLADQVNKNLTKVYLILASFAIIMLIVIVLLMNNTIRLALYSQRFLIRSMQLVGAKNSFIQLPFLKKGAIQGLLSGVLAASLIYGLLQLAIQQIEGLAILQENTKLYTLLAAIVLLGILIGVTSTFQSLVRYLKMTVDELY